MASLRMQPTFVVYLPGSADETVQAMRNAIAREPLRGTADAAGRVIDFKIAQDDQRFWSPHLSVQIGDEPDGGVESGTGPPRSHLVARFSPRPEIWTLFMAIYFSTAVCMAGAAVYGYVQWMMGGAPWALLLIPAGAGLIGALHLASLIGQGLSHDQMEILKARFEQAFAAAAADLAKHRQPAALGTDDCPEVTATG